MEAVGRNAKVLRGRTALQGPLNGVTVRTGAPLCSFRSQNQPPPLFLLLPPEFIYVAQRPRVDR